MSQILSLTDIQAILPQRNPFLMLDRAQLGEEAGTITAVKNVTINEPQFTGHFPDNPIMPGVLQLLAMTQASTIAFKKLTGDNEGFYNLKTVKKLRFKSPIIPGDQVIIDAKVDEEGNVTASCKVAGKVSSQATFSIAKLDEASLVPQSLTTEFKSDLFEDTDARVYDINGITAKIPHRFPFQFIDTVRYHAEDRIIGEKLVSGNEPFANGYLPNTPMMPSVMLMETAAQLACVYMLDQEGNEDKIGLYLGIEDAVVNRPAVPGDKLTFDVQVLFLKGKMGRCKADIYCGEEKIAELAMAFALVPKEG